MTYLVVDIMIICVVSAEHLQWVIWQTIPAMVVYGLESRYREKEHSFPCRHAYDVFCDSSSEGVEQETFQWMVIEGTKSIGNIEAVMDGMKFFVEVGVHVHSSMKEVLPCVDDNPGGSGIQLNIDRNTTIGNGRTFQARTWLLE